MTLQEIILGNELLVSALGIILMVGLLYLRKVGPRRAVVLAGIRRWVLPLAERLLGDRVRDLARDKTDATDEYICTVGAGVGLIELARALWQSGYRWNPISTKKYRVVNGEWQYAVLSVALRQSVAADGQHHVYIFPALQGTGYDIYGHYEANVTDPADHAGGDEQVAGDPDHALRNALAAAGIGYEQRPHTPPA